MFRVFSVSLLLGLISLNSFAQHDARGGSDGGGGRGVVCYADAAQKTIQSVELLDLYEGKLLEGYEIPEQKGSFLEIYTRIIEKSASSNVKALMGNGEKIYKSFKFLRTGVRLNPINDSGEIFIPANCKIEQIVNFQGISRIFVVKDYWDLMSETSKAALIAHELIWYVDRNAGANTSARSRRTVARFFASNYTFKKVFLKPKAGDYDCSSENPYHRTNNFTTGNYFYLTKIPKPQREAGSYDCEVNFIIMDGSPVFTEHKATIDYCEDLYLDVKTEEAGDIGSEEQGGFTFEVKSTNDQVVTHYLTVYTEVVKESNGSAVVKRAMHLTNLEFPGYDRDKSLSLDCGEADEEDEKKDLFSPKEALQGLI